MKGSEQIMWYRMRGQRKIYLRFTVKQQMSGAEEWVVLKFMYSFLVAYQSLTVVFGQFIVSVVHQHFFQYFA